jgi:hypothetical protein
MRFLAMVMLTGDNQRKYENGYTGDPEDHATMDAFNEELVKAGVMDACDGLHPTTQGARIEFDAGGALVTDGPFAESKELLGGFWILNVKDRDEAVAWMSKAPMQPGDTLVIRRIAEIEDFPAEVQEAAALREA